MTKVSNGLIKQRLRNRIIESLECFADQKAIETLGTSEIINGWYDLVEEEHISFFDQPVFCLEEINAIRRFHNLIESAYQTIPSAWTTAKLNNSKEWAALVLAAKEELEIFAKRGRLDEEKEIIF